MPLAGILLAIRNEETRRLLTARIGRRRLRDKSNILSLPDSVFVAYYRLSKEAFIMVLNDIEPLLPQSSIPGVIQLATTLRYLAVGSFQAVIGKDSDLNLHRTTVGRVLWRIVDILERIICPKWIQLELSDEERRLSKRYFFDNFGISGVIGCMDGKHIRIIKPHSEHFLFYNRKGFCSLNAMIICDKNMNIRCVDATKPDASHDAFIWQLSLAKSFFVEKYHAGERGEWLLADSGYAFEPFVMTPFRQPNPRSAEHLYNQKHSKARNIVERTIGVLKSRFRYLHVGLTYVPKKFVKIVNVCCAFHNICRAYNANLDEEPLMKLNNEIDFESPDVLIFESDFLNHANTIRNNIAQTPSR